MGCIYFKSRKTESPESKELISEKKEYSWDKRQKLNPKDYTIEDVVDGESIRLPGTVNGRQFIIQNCKDSRILVLDYCNTITIDDCVNCIFILGPAMGSLFIRSCENCIVVALCGQFRARDCQKLTSFLCCPSQPTIESCCRVRVGCCLLHYNGLGEHMRKAGLSFYNNEWNLVYDFTPVPSEGSNWITISSDNFQEIFSGFGETRLEDGSKTDMQLFPFGKYADFFPSLDLVIGDMTKSLVPLTTHNNSNYTALDENCLVTILPGDKQGHIAYEFIASMKNLDGSFEIVETKEKSLSNEQASLLLQTSMTTKSVVVDAQLLYIGMHFRGQGCVNKCQQVATQLMLSLDCTGRIHTSPNNKTAVNQIQQFMTSAGQN